MEHIIKRRPSFFQVFCGLTLRDSVCKDSELKFQSVFMILDEIEKEFGRGLRFIDWGGGGGGGGGEL